MPEVENLHDISIVGAGIVGLATAYFLKQKHPSLKIAVIEKEVSSAHHQTSHNSGVIHAGIYYAPGSLKARLCKKGALATKEFCKEHGISFNECGKLIVATHRSQLPALHALKERAIANQQKIHDIKKEKLNKMEPMVQGVQALFSPASAIVDYKKICQTLQNILKKTGVHFYFNQSLEKLNETKHSLTIKTNKKTLSTSLMIACAGLQADRIAALSGLGHDFKIIPFRGEYYKIASQAKLKINHLIYPVPNPSLPFLGIHLTKMIDGYTTVGPNAVFSFGRETYSKNSLHARDLLSTLTFSGFWKLMARNLLPGLQEVQGSLLKSTYLKRCQAYCPSLNIQDLKAYPSGIRAQAVDRHGKMIEDFMLRETKRTIHVCNAPSPAATCAFPIGEEIGTRALKKIQFSYK